MSMTMEKKIEYAKYLGVKVFSNKYYSIHVMLFDHGMASARIRYKKRKNERVGVNLCTTLGIVCISCRWTKRLADGSAKCCVHASRNFCCPMASLVLKLLKMLRTKSVNSVVYMSSHEWKMRKNGYYGGLIKGD